MWSRTLEVEHAELTRRAMRLSVAYGAFNGPTWAREVVPPEGQTDCCKLQQIDEWVAECQPARSKGCRKRSPGGVLDVKGLWSMQHILACS